MVTSEEGVSVSNTPSGMGRWPAVWTREGPVDASLFDGSYWTQQPEPVRRRRWHLASRLAGAFVAGFAAAMVIAQVRGLNRSS